MSVLQLWENKGHAAISARALAQDAGVPISTLYNHFASLDHVFLAAQEEALDQARHWCAGQMAQLPDLAAHPDGTLVSSLAPIMAALIDEWTHGQRRLAFAWREGFLLAHRDPRFMPVWHGWRSLWSGVWQDICQRCNLAPYGELTSFVFEGEAALHMLPWRRVLDRACLEDLCQGWAAWLSGRLATEGPWRGSARQQALASSPDLAIHDDTARRIADAAADVVEQRGMAKLTHRAVAAEAGVSLGMVSSRFRTSVDLLRGAFETIYQRISQQNPDAVETIASLLETNQIEQLVPQLTGEKISLTHRLAMEELMLATARDPDFQPFAPQLRYLRGRTSGRVLQMIAGPHIAISPLDAALFSDLLSGMQRAGIDLSPQNRASSGRAHLGTIARLLGLPISAFEQAGG